MKITIEFDTGTDGDLLKALGLDVADLATRLGNAKEARTAAPAGKGKGAAAQAAATAPSSPTQGVAVPPGQSASVPPAAAPEQPPAGQQTDVVDETLLPELRKAISSLGGMMDAPSAAKFLREDLGFQSLASIPPEQRPGALAKIQGKIDSLLTA